ncbi:hypothetical protein ACFQZI_06455 [Mucilaginibacter lutimaris]|uniref:Uncharacterized protein n=1 Tax=Mucilaginibacter lutimaris TaxID=931629 RepID=A0ABW2ZE70_9SPHI
MEPSFGFPLVPPGSYPEKKGPYPECHTKTRKRVFSAQCTEHGKSRNDHAGKE